jgi:hypothetical protein
MRAHRGGGLEVYLQAFLLTLFNESEQVSCVFWRQAGRRNTENILLISSLITSRICKCRLRHIPRAPGATRPAPTGRSHSMTSVTVNGLRNHRHGFNFLCKREPQCQHDVRTTGSQRENLYREDEEMERQAKLNR